MAKPGKPRHAHTAHGDLLTHEIRLGPHGLFVHDILFERGNPLLVEFSGFSHLEEILHWQAGSDASALGRVRTVVTVRDFSRSSTCYAGSNGRDQPNADLAMRGQSDCYCLLGLASPVLHIHRTPYDSPRSSLRRVHRCRVVD
jgi:hypothetical protein